MFDENLLQDKRGLEALMKDIRRAVKAKQVQFEDGMLVIGEKIRYGIGGVFETGVKIHESVLKALQEGDPEKVEWTRRRLFAMGLERNDHGYERLAFETHKNLVPGKGRRYNLGLLLGDVAKKSTWYPSAFSSNSTPDATWDANWAGASSGPKATEINATQLTASARAAAVFGAPTDDSIAMSAATEYTIKTGVSGVDVYGGTLNSNSAFGYNVDYATGGHVLIAASPRTTPFTGLAAGDKLSLSYSLTATST